jgi:GTP cyclohydrolase II
MALVRFSEARLPTTHGEFTVVVYRTGSPGAAGASAVGMADEEHVALVMGDVAGDAVLARVHSSCFTGEVLGSERCDCRAQLDAALARIAKDGRGVLVYLVQEGRGIGLGNKVRAYALQDKGVDTVDANLQLGFVPDGRSYEIAAGILRDLGVRSVRLMTNNPGKLAGLVAAGVPATHEPHWVEGGDEAADYLAAKKSRLGHIG